MQTFVHEFIHGFCPIPWLHNSLHSVWSSHEPKTMNELILLLTFLIKKTGFVHYCFSKENTYSKAAFCVGEKKTGSRGCCAELRDPIWRACSAESLTNHSNPVSISTLGIGLQNGWIHAFRSNLSWFAGRAQLEETQRVFPKIQKIRELHGYMHFLTALLWIIVHATGPLHLDEIGGSHQWCNKDPTGRRGQEDSFMGKSHFPNKTEILFKATVFKDVSWCFQWRGIHVQFCARRKIDTAFTCSTEPRLVQVHEAFILEAPFSVGFNVQPQNASDNKWTWRLTERLCRNPWNQSLASDPSATCCVM